MSEYTVLTGAGPEPTIPRPETPPAPYIVTVQEGLPVIYGEDTVPVSGVRVVHPTNPAAPSVQHGVSILYVPPHAKLPLHCHQAEETYVILEGEGVMGFDGFEREVAEGDFVFLPSWCEHAIENTGRGMLRVLLATSPPNP
jgi:mannose-6-phosphate isomerase-like protein (cupin superfamily)